MTFLLLRCYRIQQLLKEQILVLLAVLVLVVVVTTVPVVMGAQSEFDPYQLNGGLIAAVAGKHYVIIASDTRMIGSSGYDLLERSHISSRLYNTFGSSITKPSSFEQQQQPIFAKDGSIYLPRTTTTMNRYLHPKLFSSSRTKQKEQQLQQLQKLQRSDTITNKNNNNEYKFDKGGDREEEEEQEENKERQISQPLPITSTTSIPYLQRVSSWVTNPIDTTTQSDHHHSQQPYQNQQQRRKNKNKETTCCYVPILIGSAGCSVDCEILKRTIRAELRMTQYYGEMTTLITRTTTIPTSSSTTTILTDTDSTIIPPPRMAGSLLSFVLPAHVATLLSQILYSRRSFPYYSFCLVAGLNPTTRRTSTSTRTNRTPQWYPGEVYVYDAIGSYEQVAVACTGTGRELMQPILDRKFHSYYDHDDDDDNDDNNNDKISYQQVENNDNTMIECNTKKQQNEVNFARSSRRNSNSMFAPRSTIVDCETVEEAMMILIDAYRAVSEREIGVGDQIVIYTMEHKKRKTKIQQQQQNEMNNNNNRKDNDDNIIECNVYVTPLKKH